jgi:hypothetical protein
MLRIIRLQYRGVLLGELEAERRELCRRCGEI